MTLTRHFSALLICVAAARPVSAQTIRGTVVDRIGATPLAGVVVTVIDTAQRRVVAQLTGDNGAFTLTAAPAARLMLRAERVGYATKQSPPFRIALGDTLEQTITLNASVTGLQAVRVTTKPRCTVRPADGAEAAQLWIEARKVLAATSATQRERRYVLRARHFSRELDPVSGRTMRDEGYERDTRGTAPFVSEDTAVLSRYGFVRQLDAGGYVYSAPDADLLLSDFFLDQHCFTPQASPDSAPDVVGLAFEPVRSRHATEIAGVLWIDRVTGALRTIDFRYVNLDMLDAELDTRAASGTGGRVQFTQLPNGRWIVGDWHIRMPILRVSNARAGSDRVRLSERALQRAREEHGTHSDALSIGEPVAVTSQIAEPPGFVCP